ncbi:MAG TPA: Ig-like domain-containing protein [Clostridium sp.]|uniref:Ig-like domain-containing protein n=1 Tax=Clostridium sp. TaxID=1506 RepID=UPI002F95C70F
MNKKIISSILTALMIAGSTSLTAFAAMNKGTVVIGHNAFDLEYANDPSNFNEITDAIVAGGEVYVKGFDGIWSDNNTGLEVSASIIPAVVYKSATETTNFAAQDKDVVSEALKVTSVSDINISKNTGDIYTLPKTVTVTLADQSTKELAVTWDKVADTKVAGTFTYIGTLTMVDGVVNTGNVTVTAKLIVVDNIIKVASVSLNKTIDTLTVGDVDTLITTIAPINAANKDVTWTTSNSKVATVANGVVTALAAGTTNITATTVEGSKIANCSVTVNNKLGYVNNNLLGYDLSVRSTADINPNNVLGYMFKYEKIEILDTVTGTDNKLWDKIIYNGSIGYVSDPYIQLYTSPGDNVVNIAKNITKQFEGTSQIAGNFDGQGLSLGYLQWAIGPDTKTLQPLLNRMDREYNTETRDIFGTNYNTIHNIINTPEEQFNWAKGINDFSNNIIEPWHTQFVNLINTQDFIKIEKDAEVFSINQAMNICNKYNLKTIRGFALAFDITVQNGSISPAATKIIDDVFVGTPNISEENLLGVIANAVANSSVTNSADVLSRKMAIVNGQGTVHEITLDLDKNFGLSDTNWR